VRANGAYELGPGWPTLAEQLAAGGLESAAFVSAFVLERRFGLARGFDTYDDAVGVQLDDIGVGARPAAATVDAALGWLADAPPRFFLWVHLYDPHAPYQPPEPHRSRHLGKPYVGEIAYADAEVGRLLDGIEALFPDDLTLIAVTSDHGESLGEHGEPTHAFGVYDTTQRVPLLLAGPGLPEGKSVKSLVRLADVAPTLLELFALPVPSDLSGRSMLPVLRGEHEPPERVAWVETLATQLDMGWSPLLGVRTSSHKYIRAPRPELYDLALDPGEMKNLADDSPALVAELDGLVAERVAEQRVRPNRGVDSETADQLAALGYLTSGAPEAGESTLGVVGGIDPKDRMEDLETLREALTLLKLRRGPEAMERFETLRSGGFEIEVLRGEAALLAGQLDAARESARRAQRVDPERASAIVLLGRIEETAGQADAASERFHEALTRDPESSAALVGLGRLAEAADELDQARGFYEQARTRRRVDAEAIWRLAALAIEDGDVTAARAILAELPQRFARTPDAAARLARAEQRAGRLDLARLRVNGALQQYPDAIELEEIAADLNEGAGGAPEP
jgi:tetratricopeptide (TPR) repeat protein